MDITVNYKQIYLFNTFITIFNIINVINKISIKIQ